jgi:hypothetical protein
MKRIWVHVGLAVSTALVTGAVVSACAHNNASLFIRQVLEPTIPSNGTCIYTADPTQATLNVGTVDLSFTSLTTYSPVILIGNQIIAQANLNEDRAETSRIIVNGAITRITDLAGGDVLAMLNGMCNPASGAKDDAACATGASVVNGTLATPVNPFSTAEASAVDPGTGTTASFATMSVTMVDSATVAILRAYFTNALNMNGAAAFSTSIQLLTYTKIEGTTQGNDPQESNELEFPVTFSYGNLVANLATESGSAVGYCLDTAISVPTTAQTCVYGQDIPVIVGALSDPIIPDCPKPDGGTILSFDAGGGDGG